MTKKINKYRKNDFCSYSGKICINKEVILLEYVIDYLLKSNEFEILCKRYLLKRGYIISNFTL